MSIATAKLGIENGGSIIENHSSTNENGGLISVNASLIIENRGSIIENASLNIENDSLIIENRGQIIENAELGILKCKKILYPSKTIQP